MSTTKLCARPDCGNTFDRRPREDTWAWNRRKYCSKRCASIDTRTVKKTGVDDRRVVQAVAREEYVSPPYCGLLGYRSEPPVHLAAAVLSRMMRGACR